MDQTIHPPVEPDVDRYSQAETLAGLSGDSSESAFLGIFLKYQGQLYSYICALTPALDTADEVFQRVSLALWRKKDTYDTSKPFLHWAMGFAKTEVRKILGELQRQPMVLTPEAIECIDRHFETSDATAMRVEALDHCLKKLPHRQQSLVRLCYSGSRKIQEIALSMNQTPNSIYLQLKRIREALYECIMTRVKETSPN
jgi:RNA polymerase sigma-70 factor, Rhodopirellula/Verrucomicrobium family